MAADLGRALDTERDGALLRQSSACVAAPRTCRERATQWSASAAKVPRRRSALPQEGVVPPGIARGRPLRGTGTLPKAVYSCGAACRECGLPRRGHYQGGTTTPAGGRYTRRSTPGYARDGALLRHSACAARTCRVGVPRTRPEGDEATPRQSSACAAAPRSGLP